MEGEKQHGLGKDNKCSPASLFGCKKLLLLCVVGSNFTKNTYM